MNLFSRHGGSSARHHVFLRCVSVFTALTFLPSSVQAWHFMPAAYAGGGGATESIDLEALLDMESSLRTASDPRMPDSPAQPFMLADANPAALPAAPVPQLPDAQTADQGLSVIPAKAGIQERDEVDPASALDPRLRGCRLN